MLALGFFISGVVKVRGERFASGLPINNPLGHYLEALHYTGYDRIKYILPFKQVKKNGHPAGEKPLSNKFPFCFSDVLLQ